MNDDVIDSLRAALLENPDSLTVRLSLARLLYDAHRHEEAEREYLAGLERAPHDARLAQGLAQVFYTRGKFSAALVILEGLTERDAPSADIMLLLARCYFEQEEHEQACDAYRSAQALDPELSDPKLAHFSELEPDEDSEPLREYAHGDPEGRFEPHAERPHVCFADIGGMESLKDEVRLKIIHPLSHPEIYEAYGKKIGGGILLYGPPGCGKTHLARATSGEVDAAFISVGISDVLGVYHGESEKNLRDIFASARARKPTVLFFDEVDALAASRRDMRQSAGRQVINQFLSELDGLDASNDGLLIMAATNAPWHLDGAFRRPGRFDRILFVPPPDEEARRAILKVMLRDKPAADVNLDTVAKKTPDYSGADLHALIDLAIEDKLRIAIKTGIPEPLTTKDLMRAAKRVKPSTKDWFATARNHALYANAGGLYDDVLNYLGIDR